MTTPEYETIKNLTDQIQGWLTDTEGKLLYDLARQYAGNGAIVEIGSWKGKSTIWLAKGLQRNGAKTKIYAIDPHRGSSEHHAMFQNKIDTFSEFKENIRRAGVEEAVVPLVTTSEAASQTFDAPIALLFIDGAHEYELVKMDFDRWFPKVITGGMIAFHDTIGFPGPRRFVNRHIFRSPHLRNVRLVDNITVAQKVLRNTFNERFRNHYSLFIKKFCEWAVDIHTPKGLRTFGKKIVRSLQ
jgi:predicted O-methyltransferase YrrM